MVPRGVLPGSHSTMRARVSTAAAVLAAVALLMCAPRLACGDHPASTMDVASARRVLRIRGVASAEEVRAAFHRASLRAHPDKGGSEDEFIEVSRAYEVLKGGSSGDVRAGWGDTRGGPWAPPRGASSTAPPGSYYPSHGDPSRFPRAERDARDRAFDEHRRARRAWTGPADPDDPRRAPAAATRHPREGRKMVGQQAPRVRVIIRPGLLRRQTTLPPAPKRTRSRPRLPRERRPRLGRPGRDRTKTMGRRGGARARTRALARAPRAGAGRRLLRLAGKRRRRRRSTTRRGDGWERVEVVGTEGRSRGGCESSLLERAFGGRVRSRSRARARRGTRLGLRRRRGDDGGIRQETRVRGQFRRGWARPNSHRDRGRGRGRGWRWWRGRPRGRGEGEGRRRGRGRGRGRRRAPEPLRRRGVGLLRGGMTR